MMASKWGLETPDNGPVHLIGDGPEDVALCGVSVEMYRGLPSIWTTAREICEECTVINMERAARTARAIFEAKR